MPNINVQRHMPIFNPFQFQDIDIHIIGAGAVGSRLWLALIELGISNISIYDFDEVESHNLSNQIYFHEDIGSKKVDALKKYYINKTGLQPPANMHFIDHKIDQDSNITFSGIVFLLTDTMQSRKDIYNHHIYGNNMVFQVFETRMAATHGNIYQFNNLDTEEAQTWFDTLGDDENNETTACGASISVGTTASVIANLAVWQFILSLTEPNGLDKCINIFLKPLIVSKQ